MESWSKFLGAESAFCSWAEVASWSARCVPSVEISARLGPRALASAIDRDGDCFAARWMIVVV